MRRLAVVVTFGLVAALGAGLPAVAAEPFVPTGAATVASDQADYQPGATVTLTGTQWWPATESYPGRVNLVVNDDPSLNLGVDQQWKLDTSAYGDVEVAADGTFTYSFSLPGWFVAAYVATATQTAPDGTARTARVTFTDGPLPSSVQLYNWQTSPAKWATGTLNAGNSDYAEGETVPFRLDLGKLPTVDATGNSWLAPVCRDYQNSATGPYGYTELRPYNTSRNATAGGTVSSTSGAFSGVGITIQQVYDAGAGSGSLDGNTFTCQNSTTQRLVIVKFVGLDSSSQKYLLWGGYLSKPGDTDPTVAYGNSAGFYPGGSLQMRLASPDKTGGINPGAIIQLAMLSVTKVVDSGAATPDQWSFTVTGPNGYNETRQVPAGGSTVEFLGLQTGSYTVTESSVANYSFASGAGLNCTFSGSTATATVTAAAGGATNATCTFHNQVTAGDALDLKVDKTVVPHFTRTYKYTIDKSVTDAKKTVDSTDGTPFDYTVVVDKDGYTDSGLSVTGVITVTNPNTFAVPGGKVVDSLTAGNTCTVGTSTSPAGLDPAAFSVPAAVDENTPGTVTFPYSCSYPNAPPADESNTATLTWTKSFKIGDITYTTPNSSATATKAVAFSTPTTEVDASATITDDVKGSLGTVTWVSLPKTFTYSLTWGGVAGTCTDYDNTATFTTVDTETTGSSTVTVTLCVYNDLTVTKTAATDLTRTYKYAISKGVAGPSTKYATSANGTEFGYQVVLSQDGYVDSDYDVAGTITVTNDNDVDVTVSSITDDILADTGDNCVVTGGTNVTVAKNGSVTVDYSCDFGTNVPVSLGTQTNQATVVWVAYGSKNTTKEATADVDWTKASLTEVDATATISDSAFGPLNDGAAVAWKDLALTFDYTKTWPGVVGSCRDYGNTATFVTSDTEATGSASATVTLCVGADLTVEKTASGTFDRAYLWQISKDVDKTSVSVADGDSAKFNYTVVASQTGVSDSGWTLGGTITVSNPNDWQDVTLTDVTDVASIGGSCTVTTPQPWVVPKSGKLDLTYSCSFGSAPSSYVGLNTATATWDKDSAFTPDGSASGVAKFALEQAGSTDKTVTVTDSFEGKLGTLEATDEAPSASATFTYSRTIFGSAGTCTSYPNTATIVETGQKADKSVTVCVGSDLTVTKTAAGTFNREYLWTISKNVNETSVKIAAGGSYAFHYTVNVEQTGVKDTGATLSGEITLTNPNDWEAVTVDVTDAVDNGGTCTVTDGAGLVLAAGETKTFDYSCTYGEVPTGYTGTNTATVTWDKVAAFTPTGTASGTAGFTQTRGKATNETVHVTDSYAGDLGAVTGKDSAPFATGTFTYERTESGVAGKCTQYDNTATITETKQTADKTVTLCVGADLTVTKTATGTFNRTYLWQIAKDVDKTSVNIAEGGSYTFTYTVTVEQTGITDSGWAMSGKITLANPNDWQDVTLTSLTDAVDNGGICTVDAGPYVVPKGGSLTVGYSCLYASAPSSYGGTNTVTATWNKAVAFTPSGSATGTAAFTLARLGSTNETVHVTDTFGGDLGTVTAANAAPFTTASFTYGRTESGVAGTCTKYDNTATITETDASASQSVTLCVGKDLTVSKTAAGTFDRTYQWQIAKDVDKTDVKIAQGGAYTFTYTVIASQTGFTDSGWTLGGTITVSNPNDWQAVTLTDVTDVASIGGSCTVTTAKPWTVPASGTFDLAYTCSFASAPSSYSGSNTATATWDKAAAFTPTGTASGSADVTLTQAGSTNRTIHVADTYAGDLGTVEATDSAPFPAHSFSYLRTESGVAGSCRTYDNTAAITETGASASKTVTLCVGKDLTVSKTAAGTFDRTYLWQISKDVDKTDVKIASGGTATFTYTVAVEQTGLSDSGWALWGKVTIANPNDWQDVTVTGLEDAVDNGGTCTVDPGPYTVLAGKSLDVDYTCSFASAPSSYSGTNTATASWNKDTSFTPSGTASGSEPFTLSQLGSTNKTVHVTDTLGGNLGTVTATDSPAYTTKYVTYSKDFAGVGGKCTAYDNTATITETAQKASKSVSVCVGLDLTVTKTAAGTFDREYLWRISKGVDKTSVNIAEGGSYTFHYTVVVEQTGVKDTGATLTGTITLANPNDWQDITLTSLTDSVDNGGSCTVDPGPYVVPKGGTLEVGYTCSYGSVPASYTGTNTATATWDEAAAFTPNGTASGTAGFTQSQDGSANKTVMVTDSFKGDLGTVTGNDGPIFATQSFTYDRTESGVAGTCTSYDNTATIIDTGASASQKVTVCVGKDLTVSKTAAGTFDRTYAWLIDKSVDDTRIDIASGGTATFNYTVKVTPDGYTDSGWTLGGKITVKNPNDWQAITADVTDAFDGGGVCTVAGGKDVVVPAGQSVVLDYTCSFDTQPAYSGKNTATATWDKAAAFTPTGTASGTADATLTLKGETNRSITVTDDETVPDQPVTLGEPDYYFGPFEFTYSLEKQGVAGTCTDYTNTAVIDQTKQKESQKVTVCVGKDLTVTKTAAGTFNREYLWDISKKADKTSAQLNVGDSITVNYVVTASQTGVTDSGWTLGGVITVANPNDWEDVTLTDVKDVLDVGGTCTISTPKPWNVPKSGSLNLTYACTFASAPTSYTGTNTATATWDKAAAFTPGDTASGSKEFALTQAGSKNKTVTVTDTLNGTKTTLGTVTATDASPYTRKEFPYTHTFTAPVAGCTKYDNRATISETGDFADLSVTICLTGLVTSSSLCTFDVDQMPGRQFRLLFTPDPQTGGGAYKLNASNPGQFYMNGFFVVNGGETLTFDIPAPFVTQGANPIHLYTSYSTYRDATGATCIVPGAELAHDSDQITGLTGGTPDIVVPEVPDGTVVYVNIHLDFGLKATTGWTKGLDGTTAVGVSPNPSINSPSDPYGFAVTDGTATGEDSVVSINVFKKNPGVGGGVGKKTMDGGKEPLAGVKVQIYQGTKLSGTVYTDQDGWYMYSYKYTGKPTTFTAKVPAYGLSQSATLKSNGFLQLDFAS